MLDRSPRRKDSWGRIVGLSSLVHLLPLPGGNPLLESYEQETGLLGSDYRGYSVPTALESCRQSGFPPSCSKRSEGRHFMPRVGTVMIGRNEGTRLLGCLNSLRDLQLPMVYVDSGSSDGSQAAARDLGADVVDLDLSAPFTAARARNVGFRRLCSLHPDLEFVQFVDGDCALDPHWVTKALATFEKEPSLAVVCGRRREQHPNASIYNRLCDLEWDTPVGLATACGGDALMKRSALEPVGGFNDLLIAGEEPELCLRLQKAGWTIRRIDAEMTLHDAAMARFGQWFKRAQRAGHAFAEGAWMHPKEGMWRRESFSIFLWGLIVPTIAFAAAYLTYGASLLLLLAYPLLMLKVFLAQRRKIGSRYAVPYAAACVVAKFPQALGMLTYHWNRLRGSRAGLIEYKGPASRPTL
jgi:GT2 family glycosyltransferase